MTALTAKLLKVRRRRSPWTQRLDRVADVLVERHGLPKLGNYRDPVREIFYILLSARTTDAQYRATFARLMDAFPTLEALAVADVRSIRRCILAGGLATKRALQIRRAAKALIVRLGTNPGRTLKSMPSEDCFRAIVELPGMGPKSAFCVMMYSLDRDVFPVDVNVQRIAERMGAIRRDRTHPQAQQLLARIVPDGRARELHIAMVVHGRTICLPVRPRCDECPIRSHCRTGRRIAQDSAADAA
jgi:endonuclease III